MFFHFCYRFVCRLSLFLLFSFLYPPLSPCSTRNFPMFFSFGLFVSRWSVHLRHLLHSFLNFLTNLLCYLLAILTGISFLLSLLSLGGYFLISTAALWLFLCLFCFPVTSSFSFIFSFFFYLLLTHFTSLSFRLSSPFFYYFYSLLLSF